MILTQAHLQTLCNVAIQAATEAGIYIASQNAALLNVKLKASGVSKASQVVTEVDVKSQDIILNSLQPTLAAFDLALLTEELQDDASRFTKDYFWCIDPLDGTLPFIEQAPGYSVSIALVSREGEPHIGVVYDPINACLYHAIKNGGAFKNQQPLQVHKSYSFKLIIDRTFKTHPRLKEIISLVDVVARTNGFSQLELIDGGGAVMNACWVLEQAPACFIKLPKAEQGGGSSWDYAATACIFNEIGASVTDCKGHTLDLNNAQTSFMHRKGVLFASSKDIAYQLQLILDE